MWPHFINLLSHSWDSFRSALGTTTLGFIAPLVVSVVSILATLYYILRKHGKEAVLKHWKDDALIALRVTPIVTILVYGPIWFYQGLVKTVFNDHQILVAQNKKLSASDKAVKSDLDWHRHNISTSDPVFPNIIYMLQAFNSFKRDMNGEPCVLYASAPKETVALASEMMQLGGLLSGCSPFGPMGADDPELDPEVVQGTVPDAIVVHAVEGEKAADNLFSTLGNQIQLKRSYRLFKHPEKRWAPQRANEHVVWLQFGKNAKWNSERFYRNP
jgi:hypothetical protein